MHDNGFIDAHNQAQNEATNYGVNDIAMVGNFLDHCKKSTKSAFSVGQRVKAGGVMVTLTEFVMAHAPNHEYWKCKEGGEAGMVCVKYDENGIEYPKFEYDRKSNRYKKYPAKGL